MLVAMPAAVALGLASLYSLGALLCAAELRNEDVELTNGLKLVPLEQILARGIGSAILIFSGVAVIAWLLPLMWHWDRQVLRGIELRRAGEPAPSVADHRVVVYTLALLCALVAGFLLLFAPLFVAIVSAFFLVRLAVIIRTRGTPPRALPTAAALFLFAGAACTAQAFMNPRPLPNARIVEVGGAVAVGKLVAISSDDWYLTSRPHTITAVPADRIVITHLDLPPHTVWTLVHTLKTLVP